MALLSGEVDLAVHSLKDVPVTQPLVDQSDLEIAAIPLREDPADVLVSNEAKRIEDLPRGARVGTTSMRRRCQLLALRNDLVIEPLRGNIDSRLRKLRDGHFDAIILAMAGLRRTNLFDHVIMTALPPDVLLAAPGQGALALQCRRDDQWVKAAVGGVHDEQTAVCVGLERELVAWLEGDCHSPIAALATLMGGEVTVKAVVGGRDGEPILVKACAAGAIEHRSAVLAEVYNQLNEQGVRRLLNSGK